MPGRVVQVDWNKKAREEIAKQKDGKSDEAVNAIEVCIFFFFFCTDESRS